MAVRVDRAETQLRQSEIEQRAVELRADKVELPDGESPIPFRGIAAVFNKRTLIEWPSRFLEQIAPGAFAKTIREADVRLLLNHDPNLVLARTRNGTLRLSESDRGLEVEADLAPTTYARDIAILLQRGDLSQMSFAFQVIRDEWDSESDPPVRTIREVKLFDVSIVTFPAYEQTEASLRALRALVEGRTIELDSRGVVPTDISDELAPEDEPWGAPNLSDFTDKPWSELDASERRRIGRHFAWAATWPPAAYGDLKFPHHRPSDGKVVWRAVANAMARLNQAGIPDADRRDVYEHLARHYRQFGKEPPEFSRSQRAGDEPPAGMGAVAPAMSHAAEWRRVLRLRLLYLKARR